MWVASLTTLIWLKERKRRRKQLTFGWFLSPQIHRGKSHGSWEVLSDSAGMESSD